MKTPPSQMKSFLLKRPEAYLEGMKTFYTLLLLFAIDQPEAYLEGMKTFQFGQGLDLLLQCPKPTSKE